LQLSETVFVEIQVTKAVNEMAVGVASNEVAAGRLDFWERQCLIRAGADFIVSGFKSYEAVVKYLFEGGMLCLTLFSNENA